MSSIEQLAVILKAVGAPERNWKEAEDRVSEFMNLDSYAKRKALPAMIEEVFPLVFGDEAAVEGSVNFEELKGSPWSTNCWLSPKTIVTPSTSQRVSDIVSLCRLLGAKFSIRGGGHLQNPGFCSNEDGVVISLSKFTQLILSEDKRSVDIGVGLKWLEVYKTLEEHDLAVAGGRVPTVGVPGLLLGGGLSFQNSKEGFGCMGVINYEVVLGDGRIINANSKENTDLFWALKGGCSNFGVVTKIEMLTVPNKVWAEARLYPPTQNGELLQALMLYHEASEKDSNATLIWHSISQATLLIFFYCAPVEKPAVFDCFYNIPFMARVIEPAFNTIYGVVQGLTNVLAAEPLLHEMRTMSSLPDLEIYQAAEESRKEQIEALKDIESITLTMVLQPIASSTIRAGDERGGNPMGLTAQNHQWFLVMADWKNAKDEGIVREAVKNIVDTAERIAMKNGTYLPFKYANYASRDQDPLSSYGQHNLERLKSIAKKYDPGSIFQKLQNGGWLVSKARGES